MASYSMALVLLMAAPWGVPHSSSYAGIETMIVTTVITILGEVAHPLMRLFTILNGHRWVTKNVLPVIVFVVYWFLLFGGLLRTHLPRYYSGSL